MFRFIATSDFAMKKLEMALAIQVIIFVIQLLNPVDSGELFANIGRNEPK